MRLLILSGVLITCFSCTSRSSSDSDVSYPASYDKKETYQEKKKSLEEIEKESPLTFIKVNGTYRQNLIDQWVLEGTISNEASAVTFKDVVLKITYYSKTGTELGSEDKVFYEFYSPGSSKSFKIKVDGVGGTASINYDISDAVAVD